MRDGYLVKLTLNFLLFAFITIPIIFLGFCSMAVAMLAYAHFNNGVPFDLAKVPWSLVGIPSILAGGISSLALALTNAKGQGG